MKLLETALGCSCAVCRNDAAFGNRCVCCLGELLELSQRGRYRAHFPGVQSDESGCKSIPVDAGTLDRPLEEGRRDVYVQNYGDRSCRCGEAGIALGGKPARSNLVDLSIPHVGRHFNGFDRVRFVRVGSGSARVCRYGPCPTPASRSSSDCGVSPPCGCTPRAHRRDPPICGLRAVSPNRLASMSRTVDRRCCC